MLSINYKYQLQQSTNLNWNNLAAVLARLCSSAHSYNLMRDGHLLFYLCSAVELVRVMINIFMVGKCSLWLTD